MVIGQFQYFSSIRNYCTFCFVLDCITMLYSSLDRLPSVCNICSNTVDDVNIIPVLFNDEFLFVHDQQYISKSIHTSTIFCASFTLLTCKFSFQYVFFADPFSRSKKSVQPEKHFLLNNISIEFPSSEFRAPFKTISPTNSTEYMHSSIT